MRYHELTKAQQTRKRLLKKEAEQKEGIWRLMYANFDHIYRNQSHLLSEIESKLDELKAVRDELLLDIEKAELDYQRKQHIKKLSKERLRTITNQKS